MNGVLNGFEISFKPIFYVNNQFDLIIYVKNKKGMSEMKKAGYIFCIKSTKYNENEERLLTYFNSYYIIYVNKGENISLNLRKKPVMMCNG